MTRQEQVQIPGTERKTIPAIEAAANAYRDARDTRMEHTKVEVAKKADLIRVMQEHKVALYKFDGPEGEELTAELKDETTVKVKTKTPDEDA